MEGLLPMVYKTIKRSRTRRQYERLSSGAAQSYKHDHHLSNQFFIPPQPDECIFDGFHHAAAAVEEESKGHRRHKSLHADYTSGAFSIENNTAHSGKLVRFRSQKLFSCVTGA